MLRLYVVGSIRIMDHVFIHREETNSDDVCSFVNSNLPEEIINSEDIYTRTWYLVYRSLSQNDETTIYIC